MEVDAQPAQGFQHGAQLQVGGVVGSGWRCYAVCCEQPSAVEGSTDIGIIYRAEGEGETRCHQVTASLSENITYGGKEAGHRQRVVVSISETGGAHHHEYLGG